jgi:2-polyprenyl-3-methyl-5-hydroxy-6-metoxy-1,4-benzoquinol methylase
VVEERMTIGNYKDRLYSGYHSTHVRHRKGEDDARTLRVRGKVWDHVLAPLIPTDRSARILDGACGNGALVGWLASRGYTRVEGVDISAEVIADGQALGIGSLRVGDFVDVLRDEPRAFDVVVLRDVLEHVDKAAVLDTLDVVRAGLAPGGMLLLHVPNAESPLFGRVRYGDFTHETAFTSSSLNQVLLACGFQNLTYHPSNPVGTSARSRIRVAAWHATATVYRALVYVETGQWPSVVTQNIIAVGSVPGGSAPTPGDTP